MHALACVLVHVNAGLAKKLPVAVADNIGVTQRHYAMSGMHMCHVFACYLGLLSCRGHEHLQPLLGVAWDCGAVTTGRLRVSRFMHARPSRALVLVTLHGQKAAAV